MDAGIAGIKGIGQKKAELLGKLGIKTVKDLLYHIPRDYESECADVKIKDLRENEKCAVTGEILRAPVLRRIKGGRTIASFHIGDETGAVEAVFFNQPYMRGLYKAGQSVCVSGTVKRVGARLQFTNPHVCAPGARPQGIMPVYPLTAGISQRTMRAVVKAALEKHADGIADVFPAGFREKHGLCDINYAIKNIHFPRDEEALRASKRRLLFEELLLFNAALLSRENDRAKNAFRISSGEGARRRFLDAFGHAPTGAQLRVMREIEEDLAGERAMSRLLQGDVGSGKTMPAFYAMFLCAEAGLQSAMMAPTEVLARQHYENAQKILGRFGYNIELLTGSSSAAQKRSVCENAAGGLADIVIGTHALLNGGLRFANLALVITDEQHRFGVNQRAALETKARAPHVLIMSATPIPRTLALILYGEADISVIDEMPPGRSAVGTFVVPESKRADMYGFLEKRISEGDQVFVVAPVIEQSDDDDMISSERIYGELRARFDRTALLHGRMRQDEKNETLRKFRDGEYDILVSTTVIEVGIDVPDAAIMVIENADRFGLAQLHQLRGRVGRGKKKSYCFLMCENKTERLEILTRTNDGFKIAEEDLRLRGPGQFLGAGQSGAADLYMASLISDTKMLELTKRVAKQIAREDEGFFSVLVSEAESRLGAKTI